MSKLEEIEQALHGYVGPFSKSIMKHQLKSQGVVCETMSQDDMRSFIDQLIKRSIFDPILQEEAKNKMMRIVRR